MKKTLLIAVGIPLALAWWTVQLVVLLMVVAPYVKVNDFVRGGDARR